MLEDPAMKTFAKQMIDEVAANFPDLNISEYNVEQKIDDLYSGLQRASWEGLYEEMQKQHSEFYSLLSAENAAWKEYRQGTEHDDLMPSEEEERKITSINHLLA